MTIFFQFGEISIQVTPEKDLCFIFKNGRPIWAGTGKELVDILKEVASGKKIGAFGK